MSDTTTHDVMVAQTEKMQEGIDYFQAHRANLETDRLAHGQAVGAFISAASYAIGAPSKLAFDPSILHSKASLLADGLIVDPNAVWQTEWRSMVASTLPSSAYLYRFGLGRAFVQTSRNWHTAAAGAANNPPYSTDYSMTVTDYILASHDATTVEINDWLAANSNPAIPRIEGHGGNTAFSGELQIASIAGKHPYMSLFIRFRNIITATAIGAGQATDQSPLQAIDTYGGNAFVGLHSVQHHPF